MTTRASSTKKVKVQRGDGAATESFTTIAEVTNFKGPAEKAAPLDATSFDSDAMEYINGLADNGELTFDTLFVGQDPQQQGLRDDLRNGTQRNFRIVLNDMPVGGSNPTRVDFKAIVIAAPEIGGGVNQVVKGTCGLRITGKSTWTYAS